IEFAGMSGVLVLRALVSGCVGLVLVAGFGVRLLDRGADLGRNRRVFGLAGGGGLVVIFVIARVVVGFVRGRFRRLAFRPIARRDVSRLVRHLLGGQRIA